MFEMNQFGSDHFPERWEPPKQLETKARVELLFNPYLFNPVFWFIRHFLKNPRIRKILVRGGSSASKTHSIVQALLQDGLEEGYSTIVLRKYGVDIEDAIFASFEEVINQWSANSLFEKVQRIIRISGNDTEFKFRGLDDSEKIKGIAKFTYVYWNELNQFEPKEWDEGLRRMRGRPGQKIIADWNPINATHWINTEILDAEEWIDLPLVVDVPPGVKYNKLTEGHAFVRINKTGDTIWINVTYRDNAWIMGRPPGELGFHDEHTIRNFETMKLRKPNDYKIYGLGEDGMIRTGGEFWKQYDEVKHVGSFPFTNKRTLHITLDINAVPYVTVSCWQVEMSEKLMMQVKEIPCRSPDNNARKAAVKVVEWLDAMDYQDTVFIYGDPSGRAKNTIDEEGKSFYDKFLAELRENYVQVVEKILKSPPSVSMSGSFINDIYEEQSDSYGWKIRIDEKCKESRSDYMLTKEGPDGEVLKKKELDKSTGQSYEKYGHFTDAKRYFIVQFLHAEFHHYKSRQRNRRIKTTTQS